MVKQKRLIIIIRPTGETTTKLEEYETPSITESIGGKIRHNKNPLLEISYLGQKPKQKRNKKLV